MDHSQTSVIELVEQVPPRDFDPDDPNATVLPRYVRLNGTSLHTSADHPIVVHEMRVGPGEDSFALVTVTLVARRVEIRQEPTENPDG